MTHDKAQSTLVGVPIIRLRTSPKGFRAVLVNSETCNRSYGSIYSTALVPIQISRSRTSRSRSSTSSFSLRCAQCMCARRLAPPRCYRATASRRETHIRYVEVSGHDGGLAVCERGSHLRSLVSRRWHRHRHRPRPSCGRRPGWLRRSGWEQSKPVSTE
jgi:hypothetical protein